MHQDWSLVPCAEKHTDDHGIELSCANVIYQQYASDKLQSYAQWGYSFM
jgi:hypothetical protein